MTQHQSFDTVADGTLYIHNNEQRFTFYNHNGRYYKLCRKGKLGVHHVNNKSWVKEKQFQ